MKTRTKERAQFLSDLLVTAIEHSGYGFPTAIKYEPEPGGDPAATFAVIRDHYEEDDVDTTWRVDIDTMARGLEIIRRAFVATDGTPTQYRPEGTGDAVYVHPDTWERLYLGA